MRPPTPARAARASRLGSAACRQARPARAAPAPTPVPRSAEQAGRWPPAGAPSGRNRAARASRFQLARESGPAAPARTRPSSALRCDKRRAGRSAAPREQRATARRSPRRDAPGEPRPVPSRARADPGRTRRRAGAVSASGARSPRTPSTRKTLGRPRSMPASITCGSGRGGQRDARDALAAADQVPLARGPERASKATEVERLQQVGLAGADRPLDDRDPRRQVDFGALVAAEVAKRERCDVHQRARSEKRRRRS